MLNHKLNPKGKITLFLLHVYFNLKKQKTKADLQVFK